MMQRRGECERGRGQGRAGAGAKGHQPALTALTLRPNIFKVVNKN